jgi:pimeloyl-ACP methyl ester carboxylesterase
LKTQYAASPDGRRIAYDCSGRGAAVVLIHGGGGSRNEWHEVGYVKRLQDTFTVITIDLLGHGHSDQPTAASDYAIAKQIDQILAVADDCGIDKFSLCGMSYGGNVGRYLAARSERVTRFIMMGTKLGPGAPEPTRSEILTFMDHWPPILQALQNGTLKLESLSEDDRQFHEAFNVPVIMAWGQSMLDWPPLGPKDFHCPVLWVVGTEDGPVMDNALAYKAELEDSLVLLHHCEGLDHGQVMDEIDQVFPTIVEFLGS